MESILRSEHRYLAKTQNNRLVAFGKWLIKHFRTYLNIPLNEQRAFLIKLQPMVAKNWQGLPLEFDELVERWLEEKTTNRSLLDLMQA